MGTERESRRVLVWFGDHVICAYTADPGQAEAYAQQTAQRFAGLRVTIDDQPSRFNPMLPDRMWWDRPPRLGDR